MSIIQKNLFLFLYNMGDATSKKPSARHDLTTPKTVQKKWTIPWYQPKIKELIKEISDELIWILEHNNIQSEDKKEQLRLFLIQNLSFQKEYIYDINKKCIWFEVLGRIRGCHSIATTTTAIQQAWLYKIYLETLLDIIFTHYCQSNWTWLISINLFADNFSDITIIQTLEEKSEIYEIPPQNISLEILEVSTFQKDPSKNRESRRNIEYLRKKGFKITIDDYDTEENSVFKNNPYNYSAKNINFFATTPQLISIIKFDWPSIIRPLLNEKDQHKRKKMRKELQVQVDRLKKMWIKIILAEHVKTIKEIGELKELGFTHIQWRDIQKIIHN